ncbi:MULTISPECIES: Rossmann-like and DUF2520 domain-containing protein [Flavobacteriaceae]|uniref:Rossmann-like and DUF2520 domain-containing protein n=1 Tax=Flavobacteriaceae TaxID=49546 RepID=UPI001490F65C|nr:MULTISPECIES: Rossmann-like and DUF2520 domain-containing protein [Allomuricauda]MDC6364472.1 DUF2520 domain-containing protein [Muricauda sp. AC10]
MLNIVILGTGNVAKHLFNEFLNAEEVYVSQVVGRNQNSLEGFAPETQTSSDFSAIKEADVYIIAVSDGSIAEVSQFLSDKKGIVAHTSGAMEMDVIQHPNKSVFYPLQTFTKGKSLNFEETPICIETKNKAALQTLHKLARSISNNVHEIDSEQRKKMHLAAVFVNNFTNYLYGVGEEICLDVELPFDLLKPLIKETAEKIQLMSPKQAQTGPARRNDQESIKKHLSLLNNDKHIELYTKFSEAIRELYEKEL